MYEQKSRQPPHYFLTCFSFRRSHDASNMFTTLAPTNQFPLFILLVLLLFVLLTFRVYNN